MLEILSQLATRLLCISPQRPVILFLSGPQGSGKSTLASSFVSSHQNALALSLDDFYFPDSHLRALSERVPGYMYSGRGCPGTHDLVLLRNVLLKFLTLQNGMTVDVPVYDKSINGGKGDRKGFQRIETRPDVILIEGWCFGFHPRPILVEEFEKYGLSGDEVELLSQSVSDLAAVVEEFADAFVHIAPVDIAWTVRWRKEQEHSLKRAKEKEETLKSWMSDDEVDIFMKRFLVCYDLYYHHLQSTYVFKTRTEREHVQIVLDESRSLLRVQNKRSYNYFISQTSKSVSS